ncbi:Stress response protein ish1 [Talaromyces islandicus]|uniref:Stress response protein ish1 n=1 Tax=Talaromyces islandicus TaxID=28573 RepID=A0A0U1LSM5_TALIS|nr:Stress response protein ish1 [Talaromyces islandicus]
MRFNWTAGLLVVLATSEAVGASNWFGRSVYNRWHETELERWLSDHGVLCLRQCLHVVNSSTDIPYPTPADRKDLEKIVKANWNAKVQVPLAQTSETASDHLSNVKEWIFDSWTESQLKSFLDHHGIPAPQPRKRDTLLRAVRENYEVVAKRLGETAAYPGNWLYEQWSESDLKEWLDTYGWPVPQPSSRDRLIAAVRRQSRLSSLAAQKAAASASSSAEAAQSSLSEALFNAWSESELKKFLDEHDVKVPQGSKRNELIALARKHRKYLVDEAQSLSASATDAYGAATSKAGNEWARATDDAQLKAEDTFDAVVAGWSNSRLKAYLDARGIPVPQNSKRDELLSKVRLHKHKAATGYSAWTFDTWTTENLQKYLASANHKAAKKADVSRQELLKQAQDQYTKASKAGGEQYASATSYIADSIAAAKKDTFDHWSESDLKKLLDSYGISTYQGSTLNEIRAAARRNAQYFQYGTTSPSETILARIQEGVSWLLEQLKFGASSGREQGHEAAESARSKAAEATGKVRSEL